MRHVRRTRHARQVALDLWIAFEPLRLILPLVLERFGLVRNLAPLDYAEPGGDAADRAKRQDFLRRHRAMWPRAKRERCTSGMRFEVVVRGIQHLPHAV